MGDFNSDGLQDLAVTDDRLKGVWVLLNQGPLPPLFAVRDLIEQLLDLDLQHGIANSLTAKLEAVLHALTDENDKNDVVALNSLRAFINAIAAQRGINIIDTDADALIADALEIISTLN